MSVPIHRACAHGKWISLVSLHEHTLHTRQAVFVQLFVPINLVTAPASSGRNHVKTAQRQFLPLALAAVAADA